MEISKCIRLITFRSTARLLQSELVKDGKVQDDIAEQLCKVLEGGKLLKHSCQALLLIFQSTNTSQSISEKTQ